MSINYLDSPLTALVPSNGRLNTVLSYFNTKSLMLALFSRAYLGALLIHYAKTWSEIVTTATVFGVFLLSLIYLRSLLPVLAAAVFCFVAELQGFPRIANHANLAMFIAAFMAVCSIGAIIKGSPFPEDAIVNGLRGLAIVVYFYVGFHKLNTAFFDEVVSCSTWFHDRISREFFGSAGIIPKWIIGLSPWFVVGLELIAAALLVVPRFWLLGLMFALPIHLYVSMSGFTDFSSMAHSIMLLFLPVPFWQQVQTNPKYQKIIVRSLYLYYISIVSYTIFSILAQKVWHWDRVYVSHVFGIIINIAVLETIAVILTLYWLIRREGIAHSDSLRWPEWRPMHMVFPLLVLIWGAFPYLFGSQTSLTMFSNLVTESRRQNHFLINTDQTKIHDFEKDLVFIREYHSSNRIYTKYDLQGYFLPLSEFSFIASRLSKDGSNSISLTIEHNGVCERIQDLSNSRYANAPWISDWLTFRQIDPYGEAKCRW